MATSSSPQPGWYADTTNPGQMRWWDGSEWTEHVQQAQQAPPAPPAPPAGPPRPGASQVSTPPPGKKKPWYRRPWGIAALVIGGLLIVSALASPGSENDSSPDSNDPAEQTAEPAAGSGGDSAAVAQDPEKPNEATEDNTPHVGANGKVTVDGLVWSLDSVRTARTIGDTSLGLGEQAAGVFVVAKLSVHSTKGESVTLTDNVFALEGGGGGATYSPDNEGSTAAMLSSDAGAEPFFLTDLQPDTTTTGTVVFDVPAQVLRQRPELRFNELGFGETHAYLRLPL